MNKIKSLKQHVSTLYRLIARRSGAHNVHEWIATLLTSAKRSAKTEKDLGGLSPHLKHLGVSPEDQVRKNQDAMRWAEKRLEEIKKGKAERN